jgi:hypothetical protein
MLTTKPILLLLTALFACSSAFVSPSSSSSTRSAVLSRSPFSVPQPTASSSTTALSERRWNFNSGQGPWGLKKNAEIWNGRMAQVNTTSTMLYALSLAGLCWFYFLLGLIVEGCTIPVRACDASMIEEAIRMQCPPTHDQARLVPLFVRRSFSFLLPSLFLHPAKPTSTFLSNKTTTTFNLLLLLLLLLLLK